MKLIELKFRINWKVLTQLIIKRLILKRSYKGYCKFLHFSNEIETDQVYPVDFKEFKKFDYFKIRFNYILYRNFYKGADRNDSRLTFSRVILNK